LKKQKDENAEGNPVFDLRAVSQDFPYGAA
jgi:hypothetical protein